jgi:MFS family permease
MVLLFFVCAIFVSAALLFSVQPMFAKMVLPQLGGSPGVWSVAMVVFQSLLLAGYAYAHALNRWMPGVKGLVMHLAVVLLAALSLPFAVSIAGPPPAHGEIFYAITLFVTAIGPSFFALSANSPLLQTWFVHTRHPSAHNPYFLYAASNVGSFSALLAYPLLLEPMLTLGQQRLYWTWGYYLLFGLLVICAVLSAKRTTEPSPAPQGETTTDNSDKIAAQKPESLPDNHPQSEQITELGVEKDLKPTDMLSDEQTQPNTANNSGEIQALSTREKVMQALAWIGLSAVPSGLLVAVTAQISTDIASAPFLWVVPLALYLMTFMIVFQTRPLLRHNWMVYFQPVFVGGVILVMALEITDNIILLLGVHLAAFFISAMVCHGELVARRPPARRLTSFYLAMSFGGMLGGMFAGLLAPMLFSWVTEYPILIVLSLLCRPGTKLIQDLRGKTTLAAFILVAIIIFVAAMMGKLFDVDKLHNVHLGLVIVSLVFGLLFFLKRWALTLTFATGLIVIQYFPVDGQKHHYVRSFFGVHKISNSSDGRYRILSHGTTIHGAQEIRDENDKPIVGRPKPLSYYFVGSPIAQALDAARKLAGGSSYSGIVGLGTGSVACLTQPGEQWKFFEIDPHIIRIARDSKLFSFVTQCQPTAKIVLGDARLMLVNELDNSFDALLIDAFSSDAIPIHLMTKEAVALYKRKLKPHGILVLHISNRHLELTSESAAVAAANGMVIAVNEYDSGANDEEYKFESTVAVLANDPKYLEQLTNKKEWRIVQPKASHRVWTDDYSNILGSMIRLRRTNH